MGLHRLGRDTQRACGRLDRGPFDDRSKNRHFSLGETRRCSGRSSFESSPELGHHHPRCARRGEVTSVSNRSDRSFEGPGIVGVREHAADREAKGFSKRSVVVVSADQEDGRTRRPERALRRHDRWVVNDEDSSCSTPRCLVRCRRVESESCSQRTRELIQQRALASGDHHRRSCAHSDATYPTRPLRVSISAAAEGMIPDMTTPANYQAPEIRSVGTIHDVTRQGGGSFTDVPSGTPTDDNTTIGDVTGKEPFSESL